VGLPSLGGVAELGSPSETRQHPGSSEVVLFITDYAHYAHYAYYAYYAHYAYYAYYTDYTDYTDYT
jgi:hypothetical protein